VAAAAASLLLTLGVLSATLAALVLRGRSRTLGHWMVAILFGANAIVAFSRVMFGTNAAAGGAPAATFEAFGHSISLVPLVVLPFVFPRRVLRPVAERWLIVATAALALSPVTLEALRATGVRVPIIAMVNADIVYMAVVYVVLSVVPVMLLRLYLSSKSQVERELSLLLLGAYLLKAAFTLATLRAPWSLAQPVTAWLSVEPWYRLRDWMGIIDGAALLFLPAAVLATLTWARARDLRAARERARDDAWLLGLIAGSFVLGLVGFPTEVEYLLLRPLLVAWAILRFGFLDVDVRRNNVLIGVAILSSFAGIMIATRMFADRAGLDDSSASTIAMVTALGVTAAIALPVARALVGSSTSADHRLLVYRAAVGAAASRGHLAETFESLRQLRNEMGVSDREHEALVAELDPNASSALRPGSVFLHRYRVVRELGRGGFGEVWLARDERLGRDVAIKRLTGSSLRGAQTLDRFQREVRLAGTVLHPRVVALHDVEQIGNDAFLVMEYLPGGTLEDRLRKHGPMDEREARQLAADLFSALAVLHEKGIVHRDVKPANVLFDTQDRAKLGDFSIARAAVSGDTLATDAAGRQPGTLEYLSPEQARDQPATPESDVYQAAATVYAALTGTPPIPVAGLTDYEARFRIAQGNPHLPIQGASAQLNEALAQALAKDPSQRRNGAHRLAELLEAV